VIRREDGGRTGSTERWFGTMKKLLLIGAGVVLVLIGIVWTLQGLGRISGSPMTGVTFWAFVGPVVAVAGLVVAGLGIRSEAPST
jgi:hypothetical protein